MKLKWKSVSPHSGEEIEEEFEIIDRGYDDQFTIFTIKGGKTTIIYSHCQL